MEVHFTPEQEAQLAQIAIKAGTKPEHLVKDAALRLIKDEIYAGKLVPSRSAAERHRAAGRKSLVEVFAPLRGLNLDFSRNKSASRPVDLG